MIEYCKLGINHHLLYPEVFENQKQHEETLNKVLRMNEFQVIDLFLANDKEIRNREIKNIKASGKDIVYNFPIFFNKDGFGPNDPNAKVRKKTLDKAKEYLDYAAQAGAKKIVYASGEDRGDENRDTLKEYFVEYSIALCNMAKEHDIIVVLEPFDRSIGKNLLIGPTQEAKEIVKRIRSFGIENMTLMVDMGHLPLMGDAFGTALELSKPYLKHVHLGNCVMRDSNNPYYGDMHPPLGIDGGENDIPQLIEFLQALNRIGYLEKEGQNTVTIEVRPYPGVDSELSAKVAFQKVNYAWEHVLNELSSVSI